jgi:hypothetical protein
MRSLASSCVTITVKSQGQGRLAVAQEEDPRHPAALVVLALVVPALVVLALVALPSPPPAAVTLEGDSHRMAVPAPRPVRNPVQAPEVETPQMQPVDIIQSPEV